MVSIVSLSHALIVVIGVVVVAVVVVVVVGVVDIFTSYYCIIVLMCIYFLL